MLKSMKARISAMMLAFVMALGAIGLSGFAELSAFAAEGDVEVGQSQNIVLENGVPETVTVNATAGQYFLYVKVNDTLSDDAYWNISITATFSTGEVYYLYFDFESKQFYSMVDITLNSTNVSFEASYYDIELATLNVTVSLGYPAIGALNAYILSELKVSNTAVTVDLLDVSGRYNVVVSGYYDVLNAGEEIYVGTTKLDYGELTMDRSYYAELDLTGVKTLSIRSTNALTVNVALYPYVAPSSYTAFPETATSYSADGTETAKYMLPVTAGELYTVNLTTASSTETTQEIYVDYGINVKTNPNNLSGTYMSGNNYPIYVSAGVTTLYFDITVYSAYYFDADQDIQYLSNVSLLFTAGVWDANNSAIGTEDIANVPVVPASSTTRYPVKVDVTAGSYLLTMVNIPYIDNPETEQVESVSVNLYVNGVLSSLRLTAANDYTVYIELTGTESLSFTSTYGELFVGGVFLAEEDTVLKLGEEKNITLGAGESRIYYLETPAEGDYLFSIMNGQNVIEVTGSQGVIVPNGAQYGALRVSVPEEGVPVENVAVVFTNHSTESSVSFYVTVTKETIENHDISTPLAVTSLAAGETRVYFISNFSEDVEAYLISVENGDSMSVSLTLGPTTVVESGFPVGGIVLGTDYEYGGNALIVLHNDGGETVSFNVSFTPADGVLIPDVSETITLEGNDSASYVLASLSKGTYEITLTLADGSTQTLSVTVSDNFGISYEAVNGVSEDYEVNSDGANVVLFFTNDSADSVTFDVLFASSVEEA